MALEKYYGTEYQQLLDAIEQYYGSGSDQWAEIAKYGIASDKAESILSQVPGVNVIKNANGKIRSYNFAPTENIASDTINSNTPAVIKSFEVPANTGLETVTTPAGETVKQMTFKSGMAQAGNFVFGEILPAVGATAVGITCGKKFDKLLYNFDPDFWDAHGMSTLNPDVWGDIIGTDTAGERILNIILGTTPDGKTQAYIDQNAFAYMALYMQNKGVFVPEKTEITPDNYIKEYYPEYSNAKFYATTGDAYGVHKDGDINYLLVSGNKSDVYKGFAQFGDDEYKAVFASLKPFKCTNTFNKDYYDNVDHKHTMNDKEYYYSAGITYGENYILFVPETSSIESSSVVDPNMWAYIVLFGTKTIISNTDGVGTQEGAKIPDLSGVNSVDEALNKLKKQYPDLWNNAVNQDVVQPDGTTKTYTYVPVAMPEIDENGNPVSSPSNQANPQVNPSTATGPLLKLITNLIQKNPPVNSPDTGSGNTPVVVIPAGSANALYSIYNPSQAQLNSFGAWLWSSNFVDQLLKLFNDPMQAIIGLHKVFASPSISGTGNIKVGYIDSGVASNIVGNQYTTVDCGSISLSEYFGNVFDYDPYTKVNLYLPFIGIVPLSVGEVMRSTIHVVYHVDVLTGACLAEVKIKRDSAGGTLFQYSGNAAVQYPISSGSYMGIISGIMSIAGGVAGTIATGGAAMPVLLGAGASVGRMHTDISHSGSFSGNAGAMGIKKPYLIIDRPQTALAENFSNYIGYPSNSTVKLSSCHGFTKVKEIHLENVPATNNELSDIEMKLKGGVII